MRHNAVQVVFEVKNVRSLRGEHINQMASYLGPGGDFGIIVSRTPPSREILARTVRVLRNFDKVILVLSDEDIGAMVNLRERKEDPSETIKLKYLDLLQLS